jgi:hypothetical protein
LKLLSYDIEIYNEIPENGDLHEVIPSVAAICTDEKDVQFYYDIPFMTKETSQKLVNRIMEYYNMDILPWGWNTTSFDFRLLAYYSGMVEECGELALNGIDGMLHITFNRGYFLGLDTALVGAKLDTKTHKVQLNDGTWIEDMSGMKAPEMWRNGEYEAVKTYLKGDVIQPVKLVFAIEKNRGIRWTSKKGSPMFVQTKLCPVKDLFRLPEPDTSWMDKPKQRKDFVDWIPEKILKKYKIRV